MAGSAGANAADPGSGASGGGSSSNGKNAAVGGGASGGSANGEGGGEEGTGATTDGGADGRQVSGSRPEEQGGISGGGGHGQSPPPPPPPPPLPDLSKNWFSAENTLRVYGEVGGKGRERKGYPWNFHVQPDCFNLYNSTSISLFVCFFFPRFTSTL